MDGSPRHDLDDCAKLIIQGKAKRLIGSFGFRPDDFEDIQQDLSLDLLTRLPRFDPDRSSLRTFVVRVVDNKIRKMVRHRTQQKRDYRCCVCSLDDPIEDEDGTFVARGETFSQHDCALRMFGQDRPCEDRVALQIDVSRVLSKLRPDLRKLASLLMHRTVKDAARELGVHRDTLYSGRLGCLRRIFEDEGLREYL